MRKLFIRYVNGSHIIWLCSTSFNTQVIRNYSPQSGGTAGTLIFWSQVPGMTPGSFARLGRRYKWLVGIIYLPLCTSHLWPLPPPPPRGMSRTLILCLQFPIVTITLWGQLACKTMTVFPRSLLLYCTAMVAYVYQTPTFPPHYGDNVKVKSQHICQAIPALPRGLGEAVVTDIYPMIHFTWKFSFQPPPPPKKKEKKILTPNTKMTSADLFCNLFPSTFPPHH